MSILGIIDFCKNLNFELNLLEVMMVSIAILLITVIYIVVKKIVFVFKCERKIDDHLRETRARILRHLTELEESKDGIFEVEITAVEVEGARLTHSKTSTLDEPTTEYVMDILMQAKIMDPAPLIENDKEGTSGNEVPCLQENSEVVPKGKRTRAMSMEERWAEYDKRRSMRNTA